MAPLSHPRALPPGRPPNGSERRALSTSVCLLPRRALSTSVLLLPWLALSANACVLPEVAEVQDASPETCIACAETACEAAHAACFAAADCQQIVACALACPPSDTTCQSGCVTSAASGSDEATAWLSCAAGACATTCPM